MHVISNRGILDFILIWISFNSVGDARGHFLVDYQLDFVIG